MTSTTHHANSGAKFQDSFSDLPEGLDRLDSFSGEPSQDHLTDRSNGLELRARVLFSGLDSSRPTDQLVDAVHCRIGHK
jgi:hypothetical protein